MHQIPFYSVNSCNKLISLSLMIEAGWTNIKMKCTSYFLYFLKFYIEHSGQFSLMKLFIFAKNNL